MIYQYARKRRGGCFGTEDSPLTNKECISPQDLVGIPLILSLGDFTQSNIGKWFGKYASQIEIIAKGNLLYNEAMMAQNNIGAVIGIKLHCNYDGLRFIPFKPALKIDTALAWKKEQIFSASTAAFIDFAVQYLKGISYNK